MQAALPLPGGFDAGPLFAPARKTRAPKRPPGDTVIAGRLRRASERRATPSWANAAATRALFKHAKAMTAATGITHSVDHLVPLNHPLVCGLHWHGNMEVLPLRDNMSKGNREWPDAWEVQVDFLSLVAESCHS
jgi:hypothetical protein